VYLNAYGQIRRHTGWQRVKDRWRGFVRGLRERRFDHFADHSIGEYIKHIRAAVEEEKRLPILMRRSTVMRDVPRRRAA
jgi:triacylglycerol lipase